MPVGDRLTIQDLQRDWQKNKFKSIYLFSGTETLLKNEAVEQLAQLFLGPDNQDVNWDRFDGKTAQAMDIATVWQTRAFFGGRRLVVVRQLEEMAKAEMLKLGEAIADAPSPNCLVLLWNDKPDPRHVLTQSVRKNGDTVVFWVPFENQMPRWIADRVKNKGKSITADAVQQLIESVGLEPKDLAPEIDKLILYVNDRPRIEEKDITELIPQSRASHYMDVDRALWRKDRPAALKSWAMHQEQGQAAELFLNQLGRVYKRLMQGKALLKEEGEATPRFWEAVRIRMRDLQGEFLAAVRLWSWDELLEALKGTLETERNIKNGRIDAAVGTTLLLCALTQQKKARENVLIP
jgi:DNA polymerase-3 subunit delta